MSDRGGFSRGFSRGGDRGDRRGRGDRGGRGRGPRRGGDDKDAWVPCTKLGRLVQAGKIRSLEHIYLYSLPIKEHQIVDHFIGGELKDEVMKIMPVQKQTTAGHRMRFKAFVVVGDLCTVASVDKGDDFQPSSRFVLPDALRASSSSSSYSTVPSRSAAEPTGVGVAGE